MTPTQFPECRPSSETEATILSILIKMENEGRSKETIRNNDKLLQVLANRTNMKDPENVKAYIRNHKGSNGYKKSLTEAYDKYAKAIGIKWDKPRYHQDAKPPRIPTREKLQSIISSCKGHTLPTMLTLSMETGLRPVELCNLRTKDVDLDKRIIYPTSAKHGNPRMLKISQSLAHQIQDHIVRHNRNSEDKLFTMSPAMYGKLYRLARNRLSNKQHDPALRQIKLYHFRHYFATNLYHNTRDLLLVKTAMGHRKIETTLIYTQLIDNGNDDYTCKVAQNVQQATELIENGFEYVTEIEGLKLFRKRK